MKRLWDLARERAPGDDLSPIVAPFLRGLGLGALVGAAIAGSALLQRRPGGSEKRAAAVTSGETSTTPT